MDWYPLWNSLRIAAISIVLVCFTGIAAAYYAVRLPRALKGVLDMILTLPLVLPPTVVGYFLLLLFGSRRPLGMALESVGIKFVMTWYGGVTTAAVVAFPLLYRTARGAFEAFDETLAQAGQTLGLSNCYIFWRIRLPACRQGIFAGGIGVRPRAGRVWRDQYANRLYARPYRDHLHHRLSAVAHRRRAARILLGTGQPCDLGSGAADREPA